MDLWSSDRTHQKIYHESCVYNCKLSNSHATLTKTYEVTEIDFNGMFGLSQEI